MHQAAIPSVPRSVRNPIESNQANVDGTLNVLVAARDAWSETSRICGFVFCIWGFAGYAEERRYDPRSDFSVRCSKTRRRILYDRRSTDAMDWKQFRCGISIFLVRARIPIRPIRACSPNSLRKCWRKEQPTIHGDGEQSRDFTFVENAVAANLLACGSSAAETAGRVFNIATGRRNSLNEIV